MSNESENFAVWKLKPNFDAAIISETDIVYYKNKYNVPQDAAIVILKSDGTVRDIV
mgnify:CR=1 FL=1